LNTLFLFLSVMTALFASARAFADESHAFRYRLTLEVEVAGETRSGSSVVDVTIRPSAPPGTPRIVRARVNGDATLVEIGDGRALIALLEGVPEVARNLGPLHQVWMGLNPANVLFRLYGISSQTSNGQKDYTRAFSELNRQRATKELAPADLPTIVGLRDMNDPGSLVLVDPTDIAKALGTDVRLRRATIAITDAPVDRTIEQRMSWLLRTPDYLDGKSYCDTPAAKARIGFCPHRSHLTRSDG